ncbi:hypothetical protein ACFS07_12145 [Undibacterium arcticum]
MKKIDGTVKIFLHSGITTGCMTAIVLNAVLNRGARKSAQASVLVA